MLKIVLLHWQKIICYYISCHAVFVWGVFFGSLSLQSGSSEKFEVAL